MGARYVCVAETIDKIPIYQQPISGMNEMVDIRKVDFSDANDHQSFTDLLDHYSRDPFGAGHALDADVLESVASRFADAPMTFAFFAVIDDRHVGLATCQEGFSTFKAAPRINIHDLVVHRDFRGHGIGRALLAAVQRDAKERCACAVTLEVRADNHHARQLYESFGFSGVHLPLTDDSHLFGALRIPCETD